MKISAVPRNPSYYDTYLNQVDDLELSEAFQQSMEAIHSLDLDLLLALGDRAYAPGKWTLREVFQHLADCERVFAYRALRFGRGDQTELPGFDESIFAANAGADRRSLEEILAELRCVRESTILMFNTFDEAALRRTGVMSKTEMPVLAIGFTLIGHQNHHFRILEERYFPMLQTT